MSEFKPYGEEWEKEVMKANKGFIVDLYRNVCIKNKALEKQVKELKERVKEWENNFKHGIKL